MLLHAAEECKIERILAVSELRLVHLVVQVILPILPEVDSLSIERHFVLSV